MFVENWGSKTPSNSVTTQLRNCVRPAFTWLGCGLLLFSTEETGAEMSQAALVTGATGLLGRKALQAFERGGWKATGTGLSRANPPSILKVDLSDDVAINSVLDEVK